jgi:antitoxin ParD1/3/4
MAKTVSCYIDKHFEDQIEGLIASGRYPTAGEVIRDGLWLIEERELLREAKLKRLRAEIQKGLDSGPAREVDIKEWAEDIKRRGRERLAAGIEPDDL